ncbi:MAG: 16S rRNA (uracil(1498)-N(3))-methyltransferase [Phycisphaeraceae bacterium]|nr:16S rRNA (uracil(1498)-N(3))-methyltransferase [Phycisphaeraceae bacterium]
MHRVLIEHGVAAGDEVVVGGEEARHAVRVKRLEVGEGIELLDGRGMVAVARFVEARKAGAGSNGRAGRGGKGEWELVARVESVQRRERVRPAVHVRCPTPKGERLGEMIDALSQVGAASWGPLEAVRAQKEASRGRMERLERIAREAAKQCGRAWTLEIAEGVAFRAACEGALGGETGSSVVTVLADAGGVAARRDALRGAGASTPSDVVLLVGPEGGWDEREVAFARERGVVVCAFGPHVMRIEQAAPVGAAVVLHEVGE